MKIPLYGAGGSVSASYQNQKTTDHFVSTGKTLSGLYAGDQGIGIDVAGNTSLTAGVISSTASREKNHFNTGSLTAQNLENISRWQLESAGFQGSFGGAGQGDAHSWLGQVGQGMAANSMSLLGGGRDHNERTVSHSAVSDNITINTTSISGDLSRDVAHANGALDNKFDAQKLQNQMQASQLGTQLVGEIVGTVFQKVQEQQMKAQWNKGELPQESGPFSELEIGRDLLEAGGAAAVAALTGGNVAAAGIGTLSGNVAAAVTRDWADTVATSLTGNSDGALHDSLANLFSGIMASTGGAVGGLVAGKGTTSVNALTGAAAAAAIEQYNAENHVQKKKYTEAELAAIYGQVGKLVSKDPEYARTVFEGRAGSQDIISDVNKLGISEDWIASSCATESQCEDVHTEYDKWVTKPNGKRVHLVKTITGPFQMRQDVYNNDIKLASEINKSLTGIVKYGFAGQHDFRLAANAAAIEGKLVLAALKSIGIENPTVLEGRTMYMFGQKGGIGLALAIAHKEYSDLLLPLVGEKAMRRNRIPRLTTVGQYVDHMTVGDGGMGKDIANRPMEFKGSK